MTRRFVIKDLSAPRGRRSLAQQAAQGRNFRIFNLRALYGLAHMLSANRRRVVHHIIDDELEMLGTERQGARNAADRARWERINDRERLLHDAEIPF